MMYTCDLCKKKLTYMTIRLNIPERDYRNGAYIHHKRTCIECAKTIARNNTLYNELVAYFQDNMDRLMSYRDEFIDNTERIYTDSDRWTFEA